MKIDKKRDEKQNTTQVKGVRFNFTDSPRTAVKSEDTLDLIKPLSIQRHLYANFIKP